jgi:hypothetical protein
MLVAMSSCLLVGFLLSMLAMTLFTVFAPWVLAFARPR